MSALAFLLFSFRIFFIAINNPMYYLKLQRLYLSLVLFDIVEKIFDHSSSEIWLDVVAFHFVMSAGFLHIYLMNCLYNVFVSVSQRGTILPPRLKKAH